MLTGASRPRAEAGTDKPEPVGKAATPRSDGAPVTSVTTSARFGDGAGNPPVSSAGDVARLSALPPGLDGAVGTEEKLGPPRRPRLSLLEVVSQTNGSMPSTRPPPSDEKDATSWPEASPRAAVPEGWSSALAIDWRGSADPPKGCRAEGPIVKPPSPPRMAPTAAKERPPAPTKAALRYRESHVGASPSPTNAPTMPAPVASVPSPERAGRLCATRSGASTSAPSACTAGSCTTGGSRGRSSLAVCDPSRIRPGASARTSRRSPRTSPPRSAYWPPHPVRQYENGRPPTSLQCGHTRCSRPIPTGSCERTASPRLARLRGSPTPPLPDPDTSHAPSRQRA